MGKLIIDGTSVFEIDEECLKRRKPALDCDVEKYFLSKNTVKEEFLEESDVLSEDKKRW